MAATTSSSSLVTDHDAALAAWYEPEGRDYTARDFVIDQTRDLAWPALRQWAEDEYGLTPQETWPMTRHSLIATMIAAEQHRDDDDQWGTAQPGRGWSGFRDLAAD